jgi:hypothetical protein
MALPKLNDTPKYSLTLPSTGQELRFRPYLVKEEKVLLMAAQSEDQNQIMGAVHDVIDACIEGIDVNKMTTYDLEYAFIQLRSKSVGETTDVSINCPHCQTSNPIKIDLNDVVCTKSQEDTMIKISDEVTVEMKHPSYRDIVLSDDQQEVGFNLVASGLKTVMYNGEKIDVEDEAHESVVSFLESMTQDQFGLITAWFENSPVVKYDLDLECKSCEKSSLIEIKGMQSFF